jgi:aryl sulfotransferase
MTEIQWPQKQRDFHNHHFDSTMWSDFKFRDDDIVISTYAKSDTTWVQQIIAQLLFNGGEDLESPRCPPGSISVCRRAK